MTALAYDGVHIAVVHPLGGWSVYDQNTDYRLFSVTDTISQPINWWFEARKLIKRL